MGCDVTIYKTKEVSRDDVKGTTLLERTGLLEMKSWGLGELLTEVTEGPNGSTVTTDAVSVLGVLEVFEPDAEEYEKEEIAACKKELEAIIQRQLDGSFEETVSVNIWY